MTNNVARNEIDWLHNESFDPHQLAEAANTWEDYDNYDDYEETHFNG